MAINIMRLPQIHIEPNRLDMSPINEALDFRQRKIQSDRTFDLQREQADREKQRFALEQQELLEKRKERGILQMAKIYDMIDAHPNEAERQGLHDRTINSHPHLAETYKALNLPPEIANDYVVAGRYFRAMASPFRDKIEREAKQAEIDKAKAQTALANAQASQGKFIPLGENAQGVFDVANKQVIPVGDGNADQRAAARAAAKESGEAMGKAKAALPDILNTGSVMLRNIDAVLNDKGLDNVTGSVMGHPWTPTVRQGSANTEARLKQIQGGTFMQAYQTLKGGGTITEVEGAKAQQSIARLSDTRISPKEYKVALREARTDINDLMFLARAKAEGKGAQEAARIEALREARNAIARGANAEQVQTRLRDQYGIDPSRL